MAEPVDLELIDRLLADLAEPLKTAVTALGALSKAYEEALAGQRESQRLVAQPGRAQERPGREI